ncbi:Retrovirus-related Pol polyprotein from type-1 retrotransposable element R2 [Phytophthora ramorum]|uniref:Retrovirus-related Pol polyprotein from type-1 retrotransposable element R2 n=1 Tax=Phytophthora ramorum TaxID=164328 RepID=UPI003099A9E7|nr:Retrovirus-related Pol polyprotein from type-1 retrotransposable element R2 [Phytophthora ramorum]
MRFFWPIRERATSTDSECSTASQSSLASDASFYSAVGDESGLVGGAVDGWADPLGVRLHTVDPLAPVLALSGPETDPEEPPRAVPLLGTGDASAAATSGTGPGPAAPIAPRPLTRLEAAAGQETPRPASTTSRRFDGPPEPADGGSAGGPSPLGPTMDQMLASQAVRATLPQTEPSQPVRPAAEEAPPSAGRHDGPRRPPPPHARPLAGQGPSPASPPVAAPQLPPCNVARPGRASGMLPEPVVPGEALAAATARALAAAYGLRELEDDDSDDEDAPDDRAAAASRRHDPPRDDGPPGRAACMLPAGGSPWTPAAAAAAAAPAPRNSAACAHGPPAPESPANVLPSPARAGGMLADQESPPPPPSAPPPSPAAAAAAPLVTAVAAAPATSPVGRAAVEPRARAEPPQEQAPPASARVEPMSGDVVSSDGSSRTTDASGDGDDGAGSSDAAGDVGVVAMDVDQGARRQQPPWQRVGGKRRRLNDVDDEDTRELAELLLEEEDEAGDHAPAPRLSAASARPASVLSVYAHNAQRFQCTLCTYTAASFASLKRHRDSRHRRTAFLDRFSAGCACGVPFASRLAAANHAHACDSLNRTFSVAAAPAAGELSPTAGAANATVKAATVTPDSPRQDPPKLAATPPLASSALVVDPDHAEQQARERWGPPLPRTLVAGRVAARLSEVPAPRWGPPLPRGVVAFRIGHRVLPPEMTSDEETKDDSSVQDGDRQDYPVAAMDVDSGMSGEWLLRFDGACRANPGPGGAGAALSQPDGSVVWTCSHYMPSSSETNNTAEYTALLLGTRAAADHGATTLRVEGDSTLVIQQVRGIFATRSVTLRHLRDQVKLELARVGRFSLHHIDRQANAHADRLANRALDLRRTVSECGVHPDGNGCTPTAIDDRPLAPTQQPPDAPPPPPAADIEMEDPDDEDLADIDDGEVYAAMRVGPNATPQRRPRLRLRKLSDDDEDTARAMVERLGASLAGKITDASDWETAEGYITALPHLLYDKLQLYTQARRPEPCAQRQQQQQQQHPRQQRDHQQQGRHQDRSPEQRQEQRPDEHVGAQTRRRRRRRRGRSGTAKKHRRQRPPRVTRHHREHRLDEALDDLHAVERSTPSDRTTVRRARRRVGRVNSAIEQQRLRHRFDTDEKACVTDILAKACATREAARTTASGGDPPAGPATPAAGSADDGTCPILGEELWRFFDSVNTPRQEFAPDAPVGAAFRSALARLPAATSCKELLTAAPSAGEVEDQLQHVRGASSPGLDGVGYDVYQHFAAQLLPALTAAFKACWTAKRVPQSWKLGVVRLLHKKGAREDPANWRPICLQQAIYKLYTGLLARRLVRWLDANDRHAPGQKGFRAVNGCGEHNFLAATLVDQARRKRRTLFEVWYDFRNAFGSVPFALLWDALARLGVPDDYVTMCKGLYESAAFVVGNAIDGTTDPIALRVGVFQGCPLSPQLFNAAISPLLFALQRLPATGVQLSGDDCPGASAYADDLKIFSGTEDGIKRQHALVADFLRWTGMAANPNKCCTMSVQRDGRGVLKTDDLQLDLAGTPIPALSMSASYTYLGIGDGFDHVRRRVELAPALKQLKDDATTLLQSGLAPWQVVKAVKTYLYPRVEYALRHLRPFQQQLEGFDRHLARGLRHLLRLPGNATAECFYAPVSRGGLGLLPLTELHAALQVAHGWQLLNSKDPAIRRIARVQLRQIADARHRIDSRAWEGRDEELCELLLNSQLGTSPDAPPKRRNGDIGSLWVDVQRHLRTLGLKFATAPACADAGSAATTLQLRVPHHDKWLDHKTVLRHVKLHYKNKHWARWAAMRDQGKTARTHGGAGSGFLTRPRGMWEADYRFAVAARLNQLDTHSVLKRRRLRAHDHCRQPGCSRAETLAHVLNHCAGTMDAVRGRHDDALKHIERALHASSPGGQDRVELRVNQTVPSLAGPALRPDLQLYNHTKKMVAVVDLAVAFEEQASDDPESSALARIAAHKRAKYAGVKRHLERQGWKVHLSALVYGSLGAVPAGNHKVLTEHLGLLKRDAKRLDRQLSVACIQSSRRIWNLHCSQHRARQHQAPGGSRAAETGGTPPRTGRR